MHAPQSANQLAQSNPHGSSAQRFFKLKPRVQAAEQNGRTPFFVMFFLWIHPTTFGTQKLKKQLNDHIVMAY